MSMPLRSFMLVATSPMRFVTSVNVPAT